MQHFLSRIGFAWGFIFACATGANAGERCFFSPILNGPSLDLSTGVTTNIGGVSVAFNSSAHEFMIAWFDSRNAGQNDAYAQRVTALGELAGPNKTIMEGEASETSTAIAWNSAANEYLIVWQHQGGPPGSGGFNHAVGRVVSAAGDPLTAPLDYSSAGLEASLAFNPISSQYVLEARNFAGGGTPGILGRRISSAGAIVGGDIVIATAGAPAPAGQIVCNTTTGECLALWRDQVEENLKGRIIGSDGSLVTMPTTISATFPTAGRAAGAAYDQFNNRFLVVFSQFTTGPLSAQFVSASGTPVGPTIPINGENTYNPAIAFDAQNGFYLAGWQTCCDGPSSIKVQLLSQDGALQGEPLTVAEGTAHSEPRVAASAGQSFLVAWADTRNEPLGHYDTFAQLVGWKEICPPCPGDINGDKVVNVNDLLTVVGNWGATGSNPGDVNGDLAVDVNDLLLVVGTWGPCPD